MSFVNNGGVRIHYEVAGVGESIVLQHGFSDSLETWREYGYVDALRSDYQVILVDARGHGGSDKPHDSEDYSLSAITSDVVAVLDELDVGRAHFFGVSMGGRYGFGMARYAASRLQSLFIGAACSRRNVDRSSAFITFLGQGLEGFVPAWEAQAPISDALKARLLANDAEALVAYQQYRIDHDDDNVLGALAALTCPYRLIAGDRDSLAPYADVLDDAAQLPEGSLVTLAGVNHLESMQRVDLVLPHLLALMADGT